MTSNAKLDAGGQLDWTQLALTHSTGCSVGERYEFNHDGLAAFVAEIAARSLPAQASEPVTRLDVMSLIRSQMHRVYAAAVANVEVDTKYATEIEDAIMGIYHGRYIAGYDLRKSEVPAQGEIAKDAARYQFATGWDEDRVHIDWSGAKAEIDATIDAAMSSQPGKGEA